MVPPPIRKALANKKAPSSRAPNPNANQNNAQRPEPLRATQAMSEAPLLPGAFAQLHTDETGPDQHRLNRAYHLYLQQLALNYVVKEYEKFQARVNADELAEGVLDSELIGGFNTVKMEVPYNSLIAMKIEHLINVKEFVGVYQEFAERFSGDKSCTLDELQRALEVKFNKVVLKDMKMGEVKGDEGSGSRDKVDLHEFTERIRSHLAPQEKPIDGKSFLSVFIDALKKLLEATENVQINKKCAEETKSSVMEAASLGASSQMIAREKKNAQN